MPFGIVSGNLFQSMGKGTISLALTIFRAFILEMVFSGLFAFILNLGAPGIYAGTVVGMSIGSIVAYVYINYYLNKHKGYFEIK